MAKITLDRGPAAAQAVPAVEAAVSNISVTIQDRVGPVRIRGTLKIANPAANAPTVTGRVAVNGVAVAEADRTLTMVASTHGVLTLDHVILAPAVGDIITLRMSTTSAAAGHELTAGQSSLEVEGVSQDAALVAGVGPPLA